MTSPGPRRSIPIRGAHAASGTLCAVRSHPCGSLVARRCPARSLAFSPLRSILRTQSPLRSVLCAQSFGLKVPCVQSSALNSSYSIRCSQSLCRPAPDLKSAAARGLPPGAGLSPCARGLPAFRLSANRPWPSGLRGTATWLASHRGLPAFRQSALAFRPPGNRDLACVGSRSASRRRSLSVLISQWETSIRQLN